MSSRHAGKWSLFTFVVVPETSAAMASALWSVDSGDVAEAETAVHDALATLDRAVQKGILHKNNVNRRKSRMAAQLNKMKAASA